MGIAVITFGLKGKNRDWMPRWQHNWYGWTFHVAVATCILETVVGQYNSHVSLSNKLLFVI
jgi:hypothetical protein